MARFLGPLECTGLLLLFAVGTLTMAGCDQADKEEFALDLSEKFERIGERDGHTYYISDSTFTWPNAKARAEELTDASEGHLVTFGSEAEEDFVVNGGAPSNFWIGLTDQQSEGEWRWVTGEPLDYTNWNSEEPNNVRGGEDVAAWNKGGWNDTLKEEKKPFVLELEQ